MGSLSQLDPSEATDILVTLRGSTRAVHERVERRLFPAAVADLRSYARFLSTLLDLHEPLERRLAHFPELERHGVQLEPRRKAGHLRADLSSLGALGRSTTGTPLRPQTTAEALGCLYVLEGSTLGGRTLAPQVRRRWPDAPARFLDGYGSATGARWHQVRRGLRTGAAEHGPDGVLAGAAATFGALEQLLDRHGWPA